MNLPSQHCGINSLYPKSGCQLMKNNNEHTVTKSSCMGFLWYTSHVYFYTCSTLGCMAVFIKAKLTNLSKRTTQSQRITLSQDHFVIGSFVMGSLVMGSFCHRITFLQTNKYVSAPVFSYNRQVLIFSYNRQVLQFSPITESTCFLL